MTKHLGSGGVGHVYLGRKPDGRNVALKILRGEMLSRPTVVERFAREAEAAKRIIHPNVVRTYGAATTAKGVPFLIMEHVAGGSLRDRLGNGPLPQGCAAQIVASLCAGLSAIHAHGFVHRDIKPENILFTNDPEPQVRIIDFGLAGRDEPASADPRISQEGLLIGTPAYIAPEVVEGAPPTAASDLYGLGLVLYEMLLGRPPFSGSLRELLMAHLHASPPEAPAPGPLGRLCLDLLKKAPARRPSLQDAARRLMRIRS